MIATMASMKIILRKLCCFTCYLALCLILMSCGGGGGGEAAAPASAPTITSFTPISGSVGTPVTITGTNLTGATAVRFNGTTASITGVSATSVTATVPSGATTGTIAVTAPGGTANSSSSFTVSTSTQIIADHFAAAAFNTIPDGYINAAKSNLHIAYGYTSHGSQLIIGMNALKSFPSYGTMYNWTDDGSAGLDLDDDGIPGCDDLSVGDTIVDGVTPWVTATRNLLNNPANSHINVIVWSWCSIDGHNAQRYLDNMEILIAQFPSVNFVFMTGHAEGQSEDLTPNSVHYNNQLIRQHCATHNRILFDFADIEAYNPDGEYFWNKTMYDNLDYTVSAIEYNWAFRWIADNPTDELTQLTMGGVPGYSGCTGCTHSEIPVQANLNCVLKGRAVWWLWARIAGWNP